MGKIIERAVKSLSSHGVTIDRDYWLKEAETAEKNQPPAENVCKAGGSLRTCTPPTLTPCSFSARPYEGSLRICTPLTFNLLLFRSPVY